MNLCRALCGARLRGREFSRHWFSPGRARGWTVRHAFACRCAPRPVVCPRFKSLRSSSGRPALNLGVFWRLPETRGRLGVGAAEAFSEDRFGFVQRIRLYSRPMFLGLLMAIPLTVTSCRQVTLPVVTSTEDCHPIEREVVYIRCSYGIPSLTGGINDLIEERARDAAEYSDAGEAASEAESCPDGVSSETPYSAEATCRAPFQTGDVISVPCGRSWQIGNHPYGEDFAINIKVAGSAFREIKLRDLLVSEAAEARLWKLVRADLRKQLEDPYHATPNWTPDELEAKKLRAANESYTSISLSRAGLVISYDHIFGGPAVMDSTIPYRRLRGILSPSLIRRDANY